MIHKFKPARSEAMEEPIKIISDFDALIAQKVGFKFNGEIYEIQPVDVENFMKVTMAYQNLLKMFENHHESPIEDDNTIYEAYFALVQPLVPKFKWADLRSLKILQLNALMNLILRQLSGDPSLYGDSQEKKNPLIRKNL